MSRLIKSFLSFLCRHRRRVLALLVFVAAFMGITLTIGKIYQHWDKDPERGAIAMPEGGLGESFDTPVYLDQNWDESDSLWFYNTTQGSALLPYDFFIQLEQKDNTTLFRDNVNIDKYRYLPQKKTFFNPDALPVGFVKETYKGNSDTSKDYLGYTCAACHTGQVNYKGKAMRIDGGPAMANMVLFLEELEEAMFETLNNQDKFNRFSTAVIDLGNDYRKPEEVKEDLEKWSNTLRLYNIVNKSHIDYGYARLDAFGRIYNRVLEYVVGADQAKEMLTALTKADKKTPLISPKEADKVLEGCDPTIIGSDCFAKVIKRLQMPKSEGYPELGIKGLLRVRDGLFNEPDAPVSYPFLWDIAHSDYVQWNGLANNAPPGPLGRNAGEVIGVFGILDWTAKESGWSLPAYISGQKNKKIKVDFTSSIDLTNLQRLESHLRTLESPEWPDHLFPNDPSMQIDKALAWKGKLLYNEYCLSCHEVIDRTAWDRLVIAKMSSLESIQTDPAMADNSVTFKGYSSNFQHTYQSTDAGTVILEQKAPVVQILTSVTKGVVSTPDPDKNVIRRTLDWLYVMAMSFFDNDIKSSVKAGDYNPDTTANPYNSLLSYKARSLNGIWATGPFLHNGSVPTLYDLLLPKKMPGDPDLCENASGETEPCQYRPNEFVVGSRELDPKKVGFVSEGKQGTTFTTRRVGDFNTGHDYGARDIKSDDGEVILKALTKEERWALVEYMKML
ncbi:di-heme-cytochrome C peroxidase [Marinibactrum halimedae]|uniref:Uncharacterized protein n=1 Tax=Marinibactrum halimedae TaxID=1444977 RepID=A0AA37WL37_9GAMM|nr:di-heme-cytochrome C peroxidase [Marinibactrum halimedae]MCD9457766.1 di-heme-cytochrome C peroxidase [Marinibactrum halimedae]GLS24860.1 hypothetical protein GCM10007877_05740 [Marinibactrum halimedae]